MEQLLRELDAFLSARGVTAYLVGGAVRDRLLDRETVDIDLATNVPATGLAREIADAWHGTAVELDARHDTARVVLTKHEGRPEVDLKSLASDIHADLLDRDFTVNAMAVPLGDATREDWRRSLVDPTGGEADLQRGELRWVTPEAPEDDPLRLLRAARLSACLGLCIPEDTARTIRALAPTLVQTAAERIVDELFPILACPDAPEQLVQCHALGLLEAVWLLAPDGVREEFEPDWPEGLATADHASRLLADDAGWLAPSLSSALNDWLDQPVAAGHARRQILPWLALLIGALRDETPAVALGEALRLSSRETRLTATTARGVAEMIRLVELPETKGSEWLSFSRGATEAAPLCAIIAAALHDSERRERLAWYLEQFLAGAPTTTPDALLSGTDLAERFPHVTGARVGNVLRALENAHADGRIGTPEEADSLAAELLANEETE